MLKRLHERRGWLVAAGVLVLALLLAQTLGLLHGIAHGPHAAGAHRIAAHAHDAAEHSHATHEHATHESHGSVVALFDTHEDESAECRLYDQLTHGDLFGFAIAGFALPAPQSARNDRVAQAPPAAAAGWFYARGPPQRT